MRTFAEICEAVDTLRSVGCLEICLLKCIYPSVIEEANISHIPKMKEDFQTPIGLSDHSSGMAAAVAAALGGMIEKHFTLFPRRLGPDAAFSMEPDEFKAMTEEVRRVSASLGKRNMALQFESMLD